MKNAPFRSQPASWESNYPLLNSSSRNTNSREPSSKKRATKWAENRPYWKFKNKIEANYREMETMPFQWMNSPPHRLPFQQKWRKATPTSASMSPKYMCTTTIPPKCIGCDALLPNQWSSQLIVYYFYSSSSSHFAFFVFLPYFRSTTIYVVSPSSFRKSYPYFQRESFSSWAIIFQKDARIWYSVLIIKVL
jgi:hypothetical protein